MSESLLIDDLRILADRVTGLAAQERPGFAVTTPRGVWRGFVLGVKTPCADLPERVVVVRTWLDQDSLGDT